jgi:hypothetical protein
MVKQVYTGYFAKEIYIEFGWNDLESMLRRVAIKFCFQTIYI